MPDLKIRGLTVEYESGDYTVRPIDNLDLDLEAGSLTLLLGPSGCGKTTLLSCLGGILSPTSGWIRYGEERVSGLWGADLVRYRRETVGIVFQAFNLIPSLTALDNVLMPMRAAGMPRRRARARAEALLDAVELGDRMGHRPADLSGGQQQRVAVARALALDPPLLLCDEPTAHLDYIQVEEILQLLRELASDERIVVVSTHDHRMLPLADQVVQMVPDFVDLMTPPQRIELAEGESLFSQGDPSDLIYVVEDGEIDILRELAHGREEWRATLGAGDYFGEMGPLFGLPRSATARARTDAAVTAFTVRDFRERMDKGGLSDLLDRVRKPVEQRFTTDNVQKAFQPKRSGRPSARPKER